MPDFNINWNALTPDEQMSPIKSSTPQASPAPNPLQGSGSGQQPQGGGSPGKGGGLLGGLVSGLKTELGNMFGGANPVSQATQAVSNQMGQMPSQSLAQSVLGSMTPPASPPQNMANKLQQTPLGQPNPTIQGMLPKQPNNPNINLPGNQNTSPQAFQQQKTQDNQLNATMQSIGQIETGGAKNPYQSITQAGGGRAAYGKYQILNTNIPSWTKAATGKSMTPQEFLQNPRAQDQTAKYMMGQYMQQTGNPNDVASMWFTGRPLKQAGLSASDNSGTTNADYQKQFNKYYAQNSTTNALSNLPQVTQQGNESVADAVNRTHEKINNQQNPTAYMHSAVPMAHMNSPVAQKTTIQKATMAASVPGANPVDVAQAYVGMGRGNKADILASYFSKSMGQTVDPRTTPWCAAFANSVLMNSGYGGTGSLAAKSFLNYGQPTDSPTKGDVVVFNSMTGAGPEHGHVGFYEGPGDKPGTVKVLGGNQGGEVSSKDYSSSFVAGYRIPPSLDELQAKAGTQQPGEVQNTTPQGVQNIPSLQGPSTSQKPNARPILSSIYNPKTGSYGSPSA